MDPERWRHVKGIFHQALEISTAARPAFLAGACASDEPLRAHVAGLLAAHDKPTGRLEEGGLRAFVPILTAGRDAVAPGSRLGPYRVIAEIGRGGMGAVYRAVRDDGSFEQEVALKLVKRGMDTDEIVRRFVHERQILAALAHPHIARLLDGGSTDDGRPYFVMELIEGQPITAYADAAGLPVRARLELFLAVTAAVQFAHQNLVVHRDLKPANVLVGADGSPKLLDFGIAKLLGGEGAATAWTALDAQPLTPDYASPEQLAGRPVTTATDIHGLGLLLYELLVGANPKAVERELGEGWSQRLASQAAEALARLRGTAEPRRRRRRLTGDLDTILAKALAADPKARYATVGELADDLERHLSQRPVRARRPTWAYRLGRAVLRHRLASILALALAAGSLAMTLQTFELDRERRRAEATTRFLIGLLKASDPTENRGAEIRVREVLDSGARLLLEEPGVQPSWLLRELGGLADEPGTRAELLLTIGEVQTNLGLREEAERSLRQAAIASSSSSTRMDTELSGGDARHVRALTLLGDLYRDGSEYTASRRAYEEALRLGRPLFGPRSLEVAAALNGLGLVDFYTGDLDSAESRLTQALTLRRQAGAPGRMGTALTLNNLGLVTLERGNFPAAAEKLEEALALLRQTAGEDHPDSLRTLSNLAGLRFKQDDFALARQGFREVLRIKRRVLGADHPDLARTWSNLATAEIQLGRLADAETSLRQSLALLERRDLAHDEVYADALNNLAAVVRDRGQLPEAVEISRQSIALYRRLLGPGHPKEASALNGLAHAEFTRGHLAEAEAAVRESLAIRRKTYGEGHPSVVASLDLLSQIQRIQGRGGPCPPPLSACGSGARPVLQLRRRFPCSTESFAR